MYNYKSYDRKTYALRVSYNQNLYKGNPVKKQERKSLASD